MFPCPSCGDTLIYNQELDIYICGLCGNAKTREEISNEGLDLLSIENEIQNNFFI